MGASLHFEAIGTTWRITTAAPLSIDIQNKIQHRIELFDKTYSRFRKDSLITRIAEKPGKYTLPEDAKPLMSFYEKMYQLTKGAMTPLIGQLLTDAGYDAEYSLKPKTLRDIPSWEDCLEYEYPNVQVKTPVLLDFGAAGKGYLIDIVGEVLQKNGNTSFTINAGGDIVNRSTEGKKLRVGLEHPVDPTKVIGVVEIENESICGSSGNRRKWSTFHHIMHPYSKKPVDTVLAVWVIAKTGLIADGLATALFFVEPEKLEKDFDFVYCMLHRDYSVTVSSNFPGEFY